MNKKNEKENKMLKDLKVKEQNEKENKMLKDLKVKELQELKDLKVKELQELKEVWNELLYRELFTEEELKLMVALNGYSIETLNSLIKERYGYRDLDEMYYADEIWLDIIGNELFTEEELELIVAINGYSSETLNNALFARYGSLDIEEILEAEEERR